MQSKQSFLRIRNKTPNNYAVAYYLGWVYFNEGSYDKAINEWERYLAIAPDDSKSASIKEHLTFLKFNQAIEYAEKAIKRSPDELKNKIKKNTIAILNFNHGGSKKSRIISKGLTAMVITDLSKVPWLNVVEREKMQALAKEMQLTQTGLIDNKTASKTGKLLLAKYIVRGKLKTLAESGLEISSTITETIEAEDLKDATARGSLANLFILEKQIVMDILETLGITKEDLDPKVLRSILKLDTENLDAFLSYAWGLDLLDDGKFGEAMQAFSKAGELDPYFDIALNALGFLQSYFKLDYPLDAGELARFVKETLIMKDTDQALQVIEEKILGNGGVEHAYEAIKTEIPGLPELIDTIDIESFIETALEENVWAIIESYLAQFPFPPPFP